MTHLPPIPDAAEAPYPSHPAPIPEEQKQAASTAEAEAAELERAGHQRQKTRAAIGIGSTLAIGAAALGLGIYAGRKPARAVRTGGSSGTENKNKRGKQDRARVAAGQPYEVNYFARKHGITAAQARAIIKEAGADRDAANKLAQSRK
jgi:hypothetical protein